MTERNGQSYLTGLQYWAPGPSQRVPILETPEELSLALLQRSLRKTRQKIAGPNAGFRRQLFSQPRNLRNRILIYRNLPSLKGTTRLVAVASDMSGSFAIEALAFCSQSFGSF